MSKYIKSILGWMSVISCILILFMEYGCFIDVDIFNIALIALFGGCSVGILYCFIQDF